MKPFHNATASSVREVRSLRVCGYCDGLGNADRMLAGPIKAYAHGRCFVAVHGEACLLKLPREQLIRLTLGDIGGALMGRLLDKEPTHAD